MVRPMIAVLFAALTPSLLVSQQPVSPPRPNETPAEDTVTVETDGERPDATQADLAEVEQQIVALTNAFRREKERSPVEVDERLSAAATDFAGYMAGTDRYGHSADKRTPPERLAAVDYDDCIVAENIAYRFRSTGFETDELAAGFVAGWKESPTHRRNMLDRNVLATGVAVAKSDATGVYYAVQIFARPQSASIHFEVVNDSERTINYRVGERDFSLSPRMTRSHEECRPTVVRFVTIDPDLKASHPSDVYARFYVTGGERLRARPAP